MVIGLAERELRIQTSPISLKITLYHILSVRIFDYNFHYFRKQSKLYSNTLLLFCLHQKRITIDLKKIYNETNKLIFFLSISYKKYPRYAREVRCISNQKLIIQSMAAGIEHSTGYSYPWDYYLIV